MLAARAALADDGAVHLVAHRGRRGPGTIGVREDVEVRQRRRRQVVEVRLRSRRRSRPGNPTIMSEPIDACGRRVDDRRRRAARYVGERVRPAHHAEHPIARVLQRQVEMRREAAAARGHEVDDRRRAVHRLERADAERRRRAATASSARSSSTSERRGSRSRPYEPRCTPVRAISLKPAAAIRATSRTTSSIGRLRPAPRVVGMMQ